MALDNEQEKRLIEAKEDLGELKALMHDRRIGSKKEKDIQLFYFYENIIKDISNKIDIVLF
jgi:hypothetical protein